MSYAHTQASRPPTCRRRQAERRLYGAGHEHRPRGQGVSGVREAKDAPIFTTQWHPEKAACEFKIGANLINDIVHTSATISASFYPAFFFVDAARANERASASADDENAALVYNYSPIFEPKEGISTLFEQLYFFPPSQ